MKKRNWFVDINEFSPMLNGSRLIIREDNNNNNGENDGLMVIGLSEVNPGIRGGLSQEDACLISAAPDMIEALKAIMNEGLNEATFLSAQKAIKKASGIFDAA